MKYNDCFPFSGVPNAITRLANEDLKATLAVSLHAPTQALRETLVPSAKAYPLEALMAECVTFGKVTGRRVTFEYTLLAGVNDSNDHVSGLVLSDVGTNGLPVVSTSDWLD